MQDEIDESSGPEEANAQAPKEADAFPIFPCHSACSAATPSKSQCRFAEGRNELNEIQALGKNDASRLMSFYKPSNGSA